MKKNKIFLIIFGLFAVAALIAVLEYYEHNPNTAHARGSLQTIKKYTWGDAKVWKVCIEGYRYTTFSSLQKGGMTQDFEIKNRYRVDGNGSEWDEEYSVPVRCN